MEKNEALKPYTVIAYIDGDSATSGLTAEVMAKSAPDAWDTAMVQWEDEADAGDMFDSHGNSLDSDDIRTATEIAIHRGHSLSGWGQPSGDTPPSATQQAGPTFRLTMTNRDGDLFVEDAPSGLDRADAETWAFWRAIEADYISGARQGLSPAAIEAVLKSDKDFPAPPVPFEGWAIELPSCHLDEIASADRESHPPSATQHADEMTAARAGVIATLAKLAKEASDVFPAALPVAEGHESPEAAGDALELAMALGDAADAAIMMLGDGVPGMAVVPAEMLIAMADYFASIDCFIASGEAIPTDCVNPVEIDELLARARGIGINAPPAAITALQHASAAISSMEHQIGQMKGMFGDEDGTIADALQDGEDSRREIEAVLNAADASQPHIAIGVYGGLVQWTVASSPMRVTIVDCDTEGADESELTTVADYDGDEYQASVGTGKPDEIKPAWLEQFTA